MPTRIYLTAARVSRSFRTTLFVLMLGGAVLPGPTAVAADNRVGERLIVVGDEGLLDRVIVLDRTAIADLRADIAMARAEIERAVGEIRRAKAELRDVPGARTIVRVAFALASDAAEMAAGEALAEARRSISQAEQRLASADVSEEERVETAQALNGLRDDLTSLEAALEALIAALNE